MADRSAAAKKGWETRRRRMAGEASRKPVPQDMRGQYSEIKRQERREADLRARADRLRSEYARFENRRGDSKETRASKAAARQRIRANYDEMLLQLGDAHSRILQLKRQARRG